MPGWAWFLIGVAIGLIILIIPMTVWFKKVVDNWDRAWGYK